MDSVVAIEPFTTKASQRGDDHWLIQSKLVLHDSMNGGVGFDAPHPYAMLSVVVRYQRHALLLIEV
jgi:hypothetical protein